MTTKSANLFEHTAGGLSIAVLGPPGTGKSTFLGSTGAYGKAKLLATKPREANSWLYRKHGIAADAELFHDPKWRPSAGSFEADAFLRLIQRIWELYEDDQYDFVLVDPFTDCVSLVANEILKIEKAATPREMRDSMSFYGALKYRLKELTQALTALQFAPKPKHVLVSVHTQPSKDDTERKGQIIKSADSKGAGVEFEGTVLPMIEGSYRREFASEFDVVFFSDVKHERTIAKGKMQESTSYVMQCSADAERHAKQILSPSLGDKYIPNDFGEILKILKEGAK